MKIRKNLNTVPVLSGGACIKISGFITGKAFRRFISIGFPVYTGG